MYPKDKRTICAYINLGARFELLKYFADQVMDTCYLAVPTNKADAFIQKLPASWQKIISDTEDQMFEDHKELDVFYTHVFYGGQLSNKGVGYAPFVDALVLSEIEKELEEALSKVKEKLNAYELDDKAEEAK